MMFNKPQITLGAVGLRNSQELRKQEVRGKGKNKKKEEDRGWEERRKRKPTSKL